MAYTPLFTQAYTPVFLGGLDGQANNVSLNASGRTRIDVNKKNDIYIPLKRECV